MVKPLSLHVRYRADKLSLSPSVSPKKKCSAPVPSWVRNSDIGIIRNLGYIRRMLDDLACSVFDAVPWLQGGLFDSRLEKKKGALKLLKNCSGRV